jgi:hypothetical protein
MMRYSKKDVSSLLDDVTAMEPVSAHATSMWYGPSAYFPGMVAICHKTDGKWYWAEDMNYAPPLSWTVGEDIPKDSPYLCP